MAILIVILIILGIFSLLNEGKNNDDGGPDMRIE